MLSLRLSRYEFSIGSKSLIITKLCVEFQVVGCVGHVSRSNNSYLFQRFEFSVGGASNEVIVQISGVSPRNETFFTMLSYLEFLNPVSKMFQCRHHPVFSNLSATNFGAVRAAAFCCGLLVASEIPAAGVVGLVPSVSATPVCVNQIAVNEGAPKRFTVPAGGGAAKFTLNCTGESESLFAAEIKNGVGDFSSWKADTSEGTYVVRIVDGEKVVGESFPFEGKRSMDGRRAVLACAA